MRSDFKSSYFDPSNGAPRIEKWRKPGRAPRSLDDFPCIEGIGAGRRRGWNRVERTHVQYNVLVRWLHSRVGRRWNDVWSEVCRFNDDRTVAGTRVREDVLSRVSRDDAWRHDLWVDADGILRAEPPKPHWRREQRQDEDRVVVSAVFEMRRIDGLWYGVRFVPMPPAKFRERLGANGILTRVRVDRGGGHDALAAMDVSADYAERLAITKNALSRTELRRNGLVNVQDATSTPPSRRRGRGN